MTTFAMTRGDSRTFDVTVTLDGVAVNLTGSALWFTAKRSRSDSDSQAVFQKTLAAGITVAAPLTGTATITLAPADTSGLPALRMVLSWDLQALDVAGKVFTLASGQLIVEPDVTQAIV